MRNYHDPISFFLSVYHILLQNVVDFFIQDNIENECIHMTTVNVTLIAVQMTAVYGAAVSALCKAECVRL